MSQPPRRLGDPRVAANDEMPATENFTASPLQITGPGGLACWMQPSMPSSEAAVLRVSWPVGAAHDPNGKGGLHALIADVVMALGTDHGGPAHTAEALGLNFAVMTSWSALTIELSGAAAQMAPCVEQILHDLKRVTVEDALIERCHDAAVVAAQVAARQPVCVASGGLREEHVGAVPFGQRVAGSPATLRNIMASDVRDSLSEYLPREPSIIALCAAHTPVGFSETAHDKGSGAVPVHPPVTFNSFPIDRWFRMERSAQAALVWGAVTECDELADLWRLEVLVAHLAGPFDSVWNRRFREELGVTYGAQANVEVLGWGRRYLALPLAWMELSPGHVAEVALEVHDMVEELRSSGLAPQQGRALARRLLQAESLSTMSTRSGVRGISRAVESGLPAAVVEARREWLRDLSDIGPAAASRLLRRFTSVVVSPEAAAAVDLKAVCRKA